MQFLDVSKQHPVEPPIRIAGLAVGAISDICATKLNALTRAELRDYFDTSPDEDGQSHPLGSLGPYILSGPGGGGTPRGPARPVLGGPT